MTIWADPVPVTGTPHELSLITRMIWPWTGLEQINEVGMVNS
jgi:hypothetical protein